MEKKDIILIVDDEKYNRNLLANFLKDDYKIIFAKNGKQALKRVFTTPPDLILLDVMMPEMDGYEFCEKIKFNENTKKIPVIFISAMNSIDAETKGLELGAIDYIFKPFNPSIVKVRVKNHLKLRKAMLELNRLYNLALDANPMTNLPGNNSVSKIIKDSLESKKNVCVIYTDLDNFKAYNDKYGFALGDKVILFTTKTLKESIVEAGCPDAFVGHIGGDDFILVVPSQKSDLVAERIATVFDAEITKFYNKEDAAAGFINSTNRQGKKQIFPIMTISMAGVDLSHSRYKNYIEVNDACSELKKKAKLINGSNFYLDSRRK